MTSWEIPELNGHLNGKVLGQNWWVSGLRYLKSMHGDINVPTWEACSAASTRISRKKADRPLNLYSRVILSADHPPCLLIRWPIFLIGLNPSPKKLYRVSGNRPNLKNWNHQAEQRLLSLSAAVAIWTYTPMSQTINLHANVARHMQFLTKVWYNNMFQYVHVCLGQFDTTICLHIYIYTHTIYIYIHLIYIYLHLTYLYKHLIYIYIYISYIYRHLIYIYAFHIYIYIYELYIYIYTYLHTLILGSSFGESLWGAALARYPEQLSGTIALKNSSFRGQLYKQLRGAAFNSNFREQLSGAAFGSRFAE